MVGQNAQNCMYGRSRVGIWSVFVETDHISSRRVCLGQNETFSIVCCGYVFLLGPNTAAGPAGALYHAGVLFVTSATVVFRLCSATILSVCRPFRSVHCLHVPLHGTLRRQRE